jgi:hypothetical protein
MTEGAYLMDKIRANCVEEGDCLIWQLGSAKIPHLSIGGKKVSVRKLVLELARVEILAQAKFFGVSCGTPMCVAEAHIRQRSRVQHARYFGNLGVYSGPLKIAKMAASKRAKSKLDDAKVAAIRASDKSSMALSAEYGVAASYITSIKAGKLWKNYTSPFAGLGARA